MFNLYPRMSFYIFGILDDWSFFPYTEMRRLFFFILIFSLFTSLGLSEQGQKQVIPLLNIDPASVQIKRNYLEIVYPMTKGLNLKSPSALIDNQEALILTNFLWDKNGALSLRKGYTPYNTSAISTKPFGGGYRYYKSNGSKYLVVADSTRLWVGNDSAGTFTANMDRAFTSDLNWHFSQWENNLIGLPNPTSTANDLPIIFDGSHIYDFNIADSGRITVLKNRQAGWYFIDINKTWDIDEWVGYYLYFPDLSAGEKIHQITSNIDDTIFFYPGFCDSLVPVTGSSYYPYCCNSWRYQILSYLEKDTVKTFYADSIQNIEVCYNQIGESKNRYRIWKDTTGFSKIVADAGYYLEVAFDSTAGGDDSATCGEDAGNTKHIYLIKKKVNSGSKTYFEVMCNYLASWNQQSPCSLLTKYRCMQIYNFVMLPFSLSVVHKNRLYLGGNLTYPSRIYYSELNEPNNFHAINYFDINEKDAEKITGLATLYSGEFASPYADLYIFKPHHIYELSGNSASTFALFEVISGIGAVAPKSIVSYGGAIFFLGDEGIYIFDGRSVKKISDKIEPIIKGMNKTKIEKASAIFYDNHYWLSYPDSSDTVNSKVLVYSPQFDAWGQISFSAGAPEIWIQQAGISDTIKMLFGKGGKIYRYGTDIKDESFSITGTYQSKWFDFGEPLDLKRLSYFDVEYSKDTGSVYLDYYKDYVSSSTARDTLKTNENSNKNPRFALSENLWGEKFGFKISTSGVGAFTLSRFGVEFKIIGKKIIK
ncbi:MAG: hypothetical protein ACOZAL_02870 [Patescibacteria group bacterium]